MAIRMRRGDKAKFDPEKMVAGEFGIATDTQEAFIAFEAGKAKKLGTWEDFRDTYAPTFEEDARIAKESAETAAKDAESAKEDADRAEEVLKSIPSDYSDVSAKTDAMYSSVESSGNVSVIDVTEDKKLAQVQMLGGMTKKSKNLFVTNLISEITKSGITTTPLGDGTFKVNGTATGITYIALTDVYTNLDLTKQYKLVGCPSGGASGGYLLYDDKNSANGQSLDTGNGVTYKPDNQPKFYIRILNGATVTNAIFKPMLVDASLYPNVTYDDYEPHRGGLLSNPIAEVKSVGKNLFDFDKYLSDRQANYEKKGNSYTFDAKYALYGNPLVLFDEDTDFSLSIKDYSFSGTNGLLEVIKKNGTVNQNALGSNLLKKVNGIGIRLNWSVAGTFTIGEMQIELGTSGSYVPYMEDKLTIPTDSLIDKGYGMGINEDCYNYTDLVPKTYKNTKSFNVGDVEWVESSRTETRTIYKTKTPILDIKIVGNDIVPLLLTSKYNAVSYSAAWVGGNIGQSNNGTVYITTNTNEYYDTLAFVEANKKVRIIYEATEGGEDYDAMLFHKRVDSIDLATFASWGSTSGFYYRTFNDMVSNTSNVLASKYNYIGNKTDAEMAQSDDMSLGVRNNQIKIKDTGGIPSGILIFELATEQIYDVTDLFKSSNLVEVEKGGTLSLINTDGKLASVPSKIEFLGNADATVELHENEKKIFGRLNEVGNGTDDIISDVWNSTKSYAPNDYAIYNDKLYKCLLTHSNIVPTNTTYWEETTIGSEFSQLNNALVGLDRRVQALES